jgi:aryl-alcohol dehydrogenase-like predicted oxidoreductase
MKIDEHASREVVHAALDAGITHFDTAEMYGGGRSEEFLGTALAGRRDDVVIATKFSPRASDETYESGALRRRIHDACEASLRRLGTDRIDLYYQHRMDPNVPIEETVGAMGELVKEGKILHIGLSEAAPERIRKAHEAHPITAVQTEYSLWTRDLEAQILPTLRELEIGLVAYSPLGRGFLSGRFTSPEELDEGDFRRTGPRFTGDNLEANLELAGKVEELAEEKDITPAQLALAWVLAQGDDVVPIPGTKRRSYLEQNAAATAVELTEDDLARIDAEVPTAAGDRYDAAGMASVNL